MPGPSLNHIIEIAKRGLYAQRLGMDIVGHNVANASTPGYSRQRVDFRTGEVLKTNQGLLGTGVISTNGGRIRNAFVDEHVRVSTGTFEDASAQRQTMSRIETKINELTINGLGQQITRFFNAFQTLAQKPEDVGPRINVINQAKRVADAFHNVVQGYESAQKETHQEVEKILNQINRLAEDIAIADREVLRLQSVGVDASDAKDTRDLLIDELSKYANVKVSEDSKGSVLVSIGGIVVASRGGASKLQMEQITQDIYFEGQEDPFTVDRLAITIPPFNEDSILEPQNRTVNITSGQLNGFLKTYNEHLVPGIMRINTLAQSFAAKVNEIHLLGYGRFNPESGTMTSELPLFTIGYDGSGADVYTDPDDIRSIDITDKSDPYSTVAKFINVSKDILSNPDGVAASAEDGVPGSNAIALRIANLANLQFVIEDPNNPDTFRYTFEEYNRKSVDELGTAIFSATNSEEASQIVLERMVQEQQAISGVSIDEEMKNLVEFQRAYDASAKIVATVNDMYLTILNMV
ncbi:MAG: flagellar hook-associated protein FlgK [Ignavibacteria bacterium]|nr:flagellar hook-associated protein FlgK [Ignavibacteria bacterium]